jgi:L-threonylcarbamoyladenylate synthase
VIDRAVDAIQRGKTVILPTDTVYGLAASAFHSDAVLKLYRLKNRPVTQPTAILAPDVEMLFELVPELRGRAGVIARALLPGPYTLVLPNPARRFRWLTGDARDTIGIRVPLADGVFREVLDEVGVVTATSANRHQGLDPKRLEDVPREIRAGCAAEIDGGELPGIPSTVVDLTGPEPKILREGAVPADEVIRRLAAFAA